MTKRQSETELYLSRNSWRLLLILFLFFLVFYSVASVGNRSEVDDAFWFAYDARDSPLRILVGGLHARHLLYLPLIRGLLVALRWAGPNHDPYTVMRYVSVVCAAASIPMLWLLLTKRFNLSPLAALLGALGFAFSYAYWRYANEAEYYSLAILLALILCLVGLRDSFTYPSAVAIGLVAALGALVYTANAVVGVSLIPMAMIASRRYRVVSLYLVVFALAFGLVTYGVYLTVSPTTDGYLTHIAGQSSVSSEAAGGLGPQFERARDTTQGVTVSLLSVPGGLATFQHDLTTGNFLLTYPPMIERLQTVLANRLPSGPRSLQEELYVGLHTSDIPRLLAGVSLLAFVFFALRLLITSRRAWGSGGEPISGVLGVGLWLITYAALIIMFASALAPEAWLPVLLPFWLLVAVFVFEPSVRAGGPVLATATVAVLLVHNLIGGFWIMRSPETDYNAVKSRWLVTNPSSNDIILTADTIVFFRYLRYHARAQVLQATQVPADGLRRLIARSTSQGGYVYSTADVLAAIRSSGSLSYALELAGVRIEEFRRVHDDEFGGVYCLC